MELDSIQIAELLEYVEKSSSIFVDSSTGETPVANPAALEHTKKLSVHYVWGSEPGELITALRPGEPPEFAAYRIGPLYEQTTWGWAYKLLNLFQSILSNSSLYSIKFPGKDRLPEAGSGKGEKETIADYLTKRIPVLFKNLERFYWEYLFPLISLDPNAYIVVRPMKGDEDFTGEGFRRPVPQFVPASNVVYDDMEGVFIRSSQMVSLEDSEDNSYSYPILFYFTAGVTIRSTPVRIRETQTESGDNIKTVVFEADPWHLHFKEQAATKCKGLLQPKTGEVMETIVNYDSLYLSFFSPTLPDFNRALKYLNDLEAMLVRALHPVQQTEPQPCNNCKGKGWVESDIGEEVTCNTCQGAGNLKKSTSVFTGLEKRANKEGVLQPAMLWITPPTEIFDSALKMIKEALLDGFRKMGQELLLEEKGGAEESAKKKELDMTTQHNSYTRAGQIYYPILQWIGDRVNEQRYTGLSEEDLEKNRIQVETPITWDTTTTKEIVEDVLQGIEANFPAPLRANMAIEAINKRYGATSKTAIFNRSVIEVDPFRMLSEDEILRIQSRAEDPQIYELDNFVHKNAFELLIELSEEDPAFLSKKSINEKILEVRTLAEAKLAEAKAKIEPSDPDPTITPPIQFQTVEN